MSNNEEGLSLVEGGALIVDRVVPKSGTFTLIMSDTMCFEVRGPQSAVAASRGEAVIYRDARSGVNRRTTSHPAATHKSRFARPRSITDSV